MEHAGLAVARAVRTISSERPCAVVVCCGTGFNGGDGLAAARHLHEWSYPLRILLTGRLDRLREEPATYAAILQRLGVPLTECHDAQAAASIEPWLREAGVIIDALLGIGSHGTVREPAASLIASMNRSGKPIVAVDIPSGLDGDTGRVQGIAVKATTTVTLGLAKHGCFLHDGPAHTGSLIVDSITMPPTLLESADR